MAEECIKKVIVLLNELPCQEINQSYLQEIGIMTEMTVYLSTVTKIEIS